MSDRRWPAPSESPREGADGGRPAAGLPFRGFPKRVMRAAATLFLEEYPQWLAEMGADLRLGNAGGLSFAAHRFRGALSHFGRPGVCEPARLLEMCARAGDLAGAARAYAALETALLQVAPDLAALARPSVVLLAPNTGATS